MNSVMQCDMPTCCKQRWCSVW